MKIRNIQSLAFAVLSLGILTAACGKEDPGPARVAPPAAESAKPAEHAAQELSVAADGVATFLIDAPLEKIKGKATRFRGTVTIDPERLDGIAGQVDVDLGSLLTETFDDAKKNAMQTEHARNWLELGEDVEAKARAENQWARFTLRSASFEPTALARAKEEAGRREVRATAEGDFWLHGVSARKSVKLAAVFEGPVEIPRLVSVRTLEPLRVSLREHDVKPRDVAGKFLQGALEKVGDKIVDDVQISLEFTLEPGKKS